MANLGQTKGPFSPAPCLLRAQEQMLREEYKNRTNIEYIYIYTPLCVYHLVVM